MTRLAELGATYMLFSMVSCAIALGVARFLARPADRDLVWKAALVGPIIASLLVALGAPDSRATIDPTWRLRRFLPRAAVSVDIQRDIEDGGVVERQHVYDPLGAAVSLGFIIAMTIRASVLARHVRRRRRAVLAPIVDRRAASLSADAVARCPGLDAVRVSEADGLLAPLALPGAEICLPAGSFAKLAAAQRHSILAHELAHVQRRDPEWLATADWISAFTPWQPLIGLVITRLARDAEFICDESAARRVGSATPLVESLAVFAEAWDGWVTPSGVSYGSSPLVARARRALELDLARAPGGRTAGLVIASALAAALPFLPSVSTRPDLWRAFPASPAVARDTVVVVTVGPRGK